MGKAAGERPLAEAALLSPPRSPTFQRQQALKFGALSCPTRRPGGRTGPTPYLLTLWPP